VTCVVDGQTCHRDAQCCAGIVCQKSSTDINGLCAAKLPTGCHDDDQCETDYCNVEWHDDIHGYGAHCDLP